MFKKIINFTQEFRSNFRDPKKFQIMINKIITLKNIFSLLIISNVAGFIIFTRKINEQVEISFTRYLSRKIGSISNITIPSFLRNKLYGLYIQLYNVNKDEILEQDLTKYKNIKEFFIRQINVIN